jgi:hypothetical protein
MTDESYLPGATLQSDGLHSPGLQGAPFLSVQAALSARATLQESEHCPLPAHALRSQVLPQALVHCEASLQSLAQAALLHEAAFAFPLPSWHFSPARELPLMAIARIKASATIKMKEYFFKVISLRITLYNFVCLIRATRICG